MGMGCGHFKCSLSRAQWSHWKEHIWAKGWGVRLLGQGRRGCVGASGRAAGQGGGGAARRGVRALHPWTWLFIALWGFCQSAQQKLLSVSFYLSSYYCKSAFLLMFTSPTRSFFCEIITFSQCSTRHGAFSYLEALYKNYHFEDMSCDCDNLLPRLLLQLWLCLVCFLPSVEFFLFYRTKFITVICQDRAQLTRKTESQTQQWLKRKVHLFHMDSSEQYWELGPSCCVARSPQPMAPISDSKGLLQTSPPCTHSNHWKEVRTHPSFLRGRHGTCILANHTWNSLQRPLPNLFILANGFWKFLKDTSASQVALVVKNPPANTGDIRDAGLIPGSGRSPGEGNGSPLQYSCLENPMDRGA